MTTTGQDLRIDAIRALVAAADARQSDAAGFARLLTEDVALVNFGGRRVLGRENVRRAMEQALQTPFAGVYTRNELVDVRFLRPDVAVVSCIKHISDERDSGEPLQERGSSTFVLTEQKGDWLIALAQTTPITV
jgi:uncharacterized protein (TIGR02246 family)